MVLDEGQNLQLKQRETEISRTERDSFKLGNIWKEAA